MEPKKFSKKEAVRFGWMTAKKNLMFFVMLLLAVWIFSFLFTSVAESAKDTNQSLYILLSCFSWILQTIIGMGMVRIALNFCDNQKGSLNDFAECLPLFFRYLGGSILYGLIMLGGFILLIIPGIVWSIKFQFFSYLIIDKQCGPVEALKKSAAITKGVKWELFIFGILLICVNFIGTLALLVGLFVSVPVTMIANAYVYRKLLAQTEMDFIDEVAT